jgi:hypothetical protein
VIKTPAAQLGLALAVISAVLVVNIPGKPAAKYAARQVQGTPGDDGLTADGNERSPYGRQADHNRSERAELKWGYPDRTVGSLVNPTDESTKETKGRPVASFVLLVSLDGLRADAVYPHTSLLQRISKEGGTARLALTIPESVTLPAHASMVSGVGVKKHGLGYGACRRKSPHMGFATIFRAAHGAGLFTAMFIGKRKLQVLDDSGSMDHVEYAGMFCEPIVRRAAPYVLSAPSGLIFVHLPDLDSAGHRYGWMSEQYLRSARRAERCLNRLVDALQERSDFSRSLLIVTADHGGHGHVHGTQRREDRLIPWMVWGGSAARQTEITRPVSVTDTAATILYALGLDQPSGIEGKAALELLTPAALPDPAMAFRAPTQDGLWLAADH